MKNFNQLVNEVVRVARLEGWEYPETARFIQAVRRKLDLHPHKKIRLPEMPTSEEWQRIFAAIGDLRNFLPRRKNYTTLDIFKAEQKIIFFELLRVTGLRVSEAANLRPEQIDLQERTIRVIQGKGGKDRIVVFSERFRNSLLPYLEKIQERKFDYVFTNPELRKPYTTRCWEKQIDNICKIAQVKTKVKPHTIRHLFLTSMAKVNPIFAQTLAGHSRIDTTMIYTHLNVDDIREAHARAIQ